MSQSPTKRFSQADERLSQDVTQGDADEFRILIASDIHLGYAEKDPIRGEDSFNTFEEILEIGLKEKADFILLGGDLFHENKPSPKSLARCVEILRKHIMGDGQILFDVIASDSISHSESFQNLNYLDENLNIRLPVFSIHGNHDDPNGKDAFSVLDILSTTGLINYFGKQVNMDKIEVSPILFCKNNVNVSLYGIGALPEERFHRYIANDRVAFLRLDDNKKKWFNIFVVHQNRVRHGTKYLPEHCLTDLPDFVVWGHEHESKKAAEYNSQQDFYIYQPGSTVATSLCPGEVATKQIGLLRIRLDDDGQHILQLSPIRLQTVRQFYLETVSLNVYFDKIKKRNATVLDVEEFCSQKIEEMIERAAEEHSGDPRQPKLPLIRLRVDYTDEYLTLSANHFGQRFVGRVANPKELILFKCKKTQNPKTVLDSNLDIIEEIYENEEQSKHCNIDDVINEYFENVDSISKLTLLGEKRLTEAVKSIVEKDAPSAKINTLIDWHINSIKDHIMKKNDVNRILEDQFLVREIMHDFKEQTRAKEENDDPIDFDQFEQQNGKKSRAKTTKAAEPKAPPASKAKGGRKKVIDDSSEEEAKPASKAKGGRKKVIDDSEEEEVMMIDDDSLDDEPVRVSSRSSSRASTAKESESKVITAKESASRANTARASTSRASTSRASTSRASTSRASTSRASAASAKPSQASQFAIIEDSDSDETSDAQTDEEEVTPAKKGAGRGRGRGRGAATRGGTRGRGRGRGKSADKGQSDFFKVVK